jgi:hypothetical protein
LITVQQFSAQSPEQTSTSNGRFILGPASGWPPEFKTANPDPGQLANRRQARH